MPGLISFVGYLVKVRVDWKAICSRRVGRRGIDVENVQFENGEVREAVILLAPDLMIEVVLEDGDV